MKRATVRAVRRVVALLDSSKLIGETLTSFAALSGIDGLITDAQAQGELAAALAKANVEMVLAQSSPTANPSLARTVQPPSHYWAPLCRS